jgi:hypothetical protein
MPLEVPSWFKGRQGSAEEAGPNTYKLTAPNVREAFLVIKPEGDGRYTAAVRFEASGPDVASSAGSVESPREAWEQAFEMYRKMLIF